MRILVPVDESLHSRRVIEFISHRETLLGTTPEIELVNVQPENRGIYTQSDSPKKSSRNIWSLAVVSVDQRY